MRILFVCTGNTCRSPMAEVMLRHMAAQQGLELQVQSAGVATGDGLPMSMHAFTVLVEQQMQPANCFCSMALKEQQVQWADVILTLTIAHKQQVIQQFPYVSHKTFSLKEYVSIIEQDYMTDKQLPVISWEQQEKKLDIVDPYGGTVEQYRLTAMEIKTLLVRLLEKWEK